MAEMSKSPEEIKKGLECLDKMQFFMGQRAGRELWADKPHEIQEKDIESFNRDIETVRNLIHQLEAQVPKWISVEDRLPEKHRYVLVHLRWGAIATGVHNGRNWWDELSIVNNDDVTHWMPPPEPPKEE